MRLTTDRLSVIIQENHITGFHHTEVLGERILVTMSTQQQQTTMLLYSRTV